ncbi:undecaprenyl-diphosphate phosphatase [Paenibacillus gansuensis]|uniref:Undecaprenyl-diphosphatase n=1 Tax=Paenibacillus gansuensis TaxID=306542 RepID=A0ABW5PFY7_9BACL
MYDILDAIIIGIVEGLTEFLPVSSTGHMILTQQLLGLQKDPVLDSFKIIIQLGAILAIALVYRKRIYNLFARDGESGLPGFRKNGLNLIHIALAIVPAMGLAFVAKDFIKDDGFNTVPVLWALIVGGLFFIFAEKFHPKATAEDMDQLTYKQALFIGLFQCISVLWPGFSRSGSTMAGGLLMGASYKAAADFSFFIAIPIMTVATGYELLDSYQYMTSDVMAFFATGFIVSFVVAWIVVVAFLRFIQKITLTHFAIYRFILAALFFLFVLR